MRKVFLFILCSVAVSLYAQPTHSHRLGRVIEFPDIPGYKTVKCDLHIHTVFSDGSVWPNIRVQEALLDGIDAISLTEHLEYQPHLADIPHPDRNRSYNIALEEAKDHNLIIIKGSEITRDMPPGHSNAIFIADANKLLKDDSIAVFREAKNQGAFIFWNHPNWTAQRRDGMATLTQLHKNLIKDGMLHGIEVVNDQTYSDEALQIAIDNNLTIMSTSDIHGLIDWDFVGGSAIHRPLTLVFAKEKSETSIKEGLMNRRTVALYKNLLIGRDEFLIPLVHESLLVKTASYQGKSNVLLITIENKTNIDFTLRNQSPYSFHNNHDVLTINRSSETTLEVKTKDRVTSANLIFEILNSVNKPNTHPQVSWLVKVQ